MDNAPYQYSEDSEARQGGGLGSPGSNLSLCLTNKGGELQTVRALQCQDTQSVGFNADTAKTRGEREMKDWTDGDIIPVGHNNFSYRVKILKNARKNGKLRVIHIPDPKLRERQREILRELYKYLKQAPWVCGSKWRGGVVQHAAWHCGERDRLEIDIRDFFGSVSIDACIMSLQKWKVPEHLITTIYQLCFLKGPKDYFLPQGAPTSPALANAALWQFDYKMARWALKEMSWSAPDDTYPHDVRYSRYCDNIVWSYDKEPMEGGSSQWMRRFKHQTPQGLKSYRMESLIAFTLSCLAQEKLQPSNVDRHPTELCGVLVTGDVPAMTPRDEHRLANKDRIFKSSKQKRGFLEWCRSINNGLNSMIVKHPPYC